MSEPRPGERTRPLTVEALVRVAGMLLDEHIGIVWVEGEVSNLRTSGHMYFLLKDRRAQLPAVIWRSTAERLRCKLEEGQRFACRGRLGVYPEQGKWQLYVDAVEPAGLGAQAAALAALKQKLAEQGLFDPAAKRRPPRLPRRVGVVTSPNGAALRDILKTIERRFPRPIVIAPARVQGDGAALDIAAGIRRIARVPGVEVVIVGRGGGSSEDLSAFNDERVVRAIAACPVPVISAVGHEIDVTLADLAADVRAATPTAAGELAVPERAVWSDGLKRLEARLLREAKVCVSTQRAQLERMAARHHRLDPRERLRARRAELDRLLARARASTQRLVGGRRQAFARAAASLEAMSPLAVLTRGYALALTPDGRVLTDAADAAPGDALTVRLARGELDVTVNHVRKP